MREAREFFNLCVFNKKPQIDELPVGKMINFEDNLDINKNILSHGRIFYVKNEGLYVRLWAFMAGSNKDDGILGFRLCPDNRDFTLEFNRKKTYLNIENINEDIYKDQVFLEYFTGEDLEGWYWGGEVFIKEDFYKTFISKNSPEIGENILGNLYSRIYVKGCLFKEKLGRFKFAHW